MAKYSYITDKTHNNRKIQVESAKRDGSGKNIENNYAKQNGNYQSLTAGLSNNLDTKLVMVDESAYNYRQTATMGSVELEVGSPCKVKKIVGGSVAFNQQIQNGNFVDTSGWSQGDGTSISASNNELSITITQLGENYYSNRIQRNIVTIPRGRVVLYCADIYSPKQQKMYLSFRQNTTMRYITIGQFNATANSWTNVRKLFKMEDSNIDYVNVATLLLNAVQGENLEVNDIVKVKNYRLIDLTQMFGSTIADYIYSLEQANTGSGVAWFKRYFPKTYYAYNSGELVSVKTQGKKITHLNQFSGVIEQGNLTDGLPVDNASRCRTSDFTRVTQGSVLHFELFGANANIRLGYVIEYDANKNYLYNRFISGGSHTYDYQVQSGVSYIKLTIFHNNTSSEITPAQCGTLCINFHYDGERDGEYEPYNSETYPCDDIDLRGIPKLDENNNLAFDGDEYFADGNVTRKYALINLGEQNWTYIDGGFFTQISNCSPTSQTIRCSKYNIDTTGNPNNMQDKSICSSGYSSPNNIVIKDSSYTSLQTAEFKASLNGVYLLAPLTTPTDENSIPFTEVQECDNWGTEEWLAPTTDTRPCEVPVGHETDYLPDLKAKLEVAPTTPNENGVYVMEHNASGNTYTLIGTWLADNGYVEPTSISGYDNTKTQTLKNVEGTLTWVDDE